MSLGWGVVGTGRVSQQLAAAIAAAPAAQLAAVVSRDVEVARQFALQHGVTRVHDTVEQLARDPEVDVVYVASPNSLHREHVLVAAAAGKHVLCEKPMANSADDCLVMMAACAAAGVQLGVGFQYRLHPAHLQMQVLLATEALGVPVFADAAVHVPPLPTPSWYADPSVAGGGVLPMSGVHRIDLLRFVLGAEVQEVVCFMGTRAAGLPYEDTVAAVLRFDNGVLATVRFGLDASSSGDGITVNGSTGWAAAAGTTSQWWSTDGGSLAVSSGGERREQAFSRADLYVEQVRAFGAAVAGGSAPPASGLDGLRAVEVTVALLAARDSGRAVAVSRSDPAAVLG